MVETTHEALLRQTATAEELLAYFQGQRGELQADIASSQAAYAALAADLNGVVANRMVFEFTWNPDDPNPTNVRGGVYNNAALAISQAPAGAHIRALIPGDKDTHWDASAALRAGQNLEFVRASGAYAKVVFDTFGADGWTRHYGISCGFGCGVRFSNVDADLGPTVDGQPYVSTPGPITFSGVGRFEAISSDFSGPTPASLVALSHGALLHFSLSSVAVDTFALINTFNSCLMVGAKSNLTLTNSGVLHQGGTVGTSVLTN